MNEHMYIRTMNTEDASFICTWQYDAPYDRYKWPSWEEVSTQKIEFGDQQIRNEQYRSLCLNDTLIEFIQLFPLEHTIRLALFLAPAYCDKGFGRHAMRLAILEAQAMYPGYEIDLEVECWNERAIRSYSSVGFHITDQYDLPYGSTLRQVYCMVYAV